MLDSKKKSMKETLLDVGIGLLISTVLNYTVLPLYVNGIEQKELLTMIQIGVIYTLFAIIRRYSMRRLFEGMRKNGMD